MLRSYPLRGYPWRHHSEQSRFFRSHGTSVRGNPLCRKRAVPKQELAAVACQRAPAHCAMNVKEFVALKWNVWSSVLLLTRFGIDSPPPEGETGPRSGAFQRH